MAASADQENPRYDAIGNFNFLVEIDGIEQARFQEVGGLNASIEAIEFSAGDDPYPRKIPGRAKYANITLKRGVIPREFSGLWKWCENVMKGRPDRRSGSIVVLDDAGGERLRFNFFFAFPVKWSGFALSSSNTGSQHIEELELTAEYFERG
jgi:phage tail-like protein